MALQFYLNNICTVATDNATPIVDVATRLISNGWVKRGSGDGVGNFDTTGSGNFFTSAAILASTTTQFPWIILEFPNQGNGITRQLCISKRNDSTSQPGRALRVKYSPVLGFHDGPRTNGSIVTSIGANSVPSSSDEHLLLYNSSTNDDTSSSSGEVWLPTLPGAKSYVYHIAVSNNSPAFWCVGYIMGTPRTAFAFMVDPVTEYDPLDQDPYVFYMTDIGSNITAFPFNADSCLSNNHASGSSGPFAMYRQGLTNPIWDAALAPGLWSNDTVGGTSQVVIPRNLGLNPMTNTEDLFPVRYTGQGLVTGGTTYGTTFKGLSSLMLWKTVNRNTATLNTTKTKICFDDVWMDWNGLTIPAS